MKKRYPRDWLVSLRLMRRFGWIMGELRAQARRMGMRGLENLW